VYYVPSEAGVLYVKFTADALTEFLLLSFKETGVSSPPILKQHMAQKAIFKYSMLS
jgi:hypothetical protein